MSMSQFDDLPKTVKKTVRYIRQAASLEDLRYIDTLISQSIESRHEKLKEIKRKRKDGVGESRRTE